MLSTESSGLFPFKPQMGGDGFAVPFARQKAKPFPVTPQQEKVEGMVQSGFSQKSGMSARSEPGDGPDLFKDKDVRQLDTRAGAGKRHSRDEERRPARRASFDDSSPRHRKSYSPERDSRDKRDYRDKRDEREARRSRDKDRPRFERRSSHDGGSSRHKSSRQDSDYRRDDDRRYRDDDRRYDKRSSYDSRSPERRRSRSPENARERRKDEAELKQKRAESPLPAAAPSPLKLSFPAKTLPFSLKPKAFELGVEVEHPLTRDEHGRVMCEARRLAEVEKKIVKSNGCEIEVDKRKYVVINTGRLNVYLCPNDDDILAQRGMLAQGGFGKVFKVLNVATGIFEAMKMPHPGEFRRVLFLAEIEMLNRVNTPSPHEGLQSPPTAVANIMFRGQVIKTLMFSPLCNTNLHSWLRERRRSLADRVDCCRQLMAAACELWGNRKIHHFDLKPKNIFVDKVAERTRFRIADFGSAITHDLPTGVPASTMGYYKPSEREKLKTLLSQAKAEHFNKMADRIDMFALGTVFYQIFTAEQGREADMFPYLMLPTTESLGMPVMQESSPFDPENALKTKCDAPIWNLIKSMVEQERKKRIEPAAALEQWRTINVA